MPRAPKAAATASQTDQVETYIQSLQKAVAAEEAEAKTLGMSNKAKQEAIDLAKAQEAANVRKKPLSADEASKVKALADAYVDAKDKIEVYNKVQENAKETASFFGNTLESALEKATERGARLGDIFEGLAKSMEQAALKALILGEGRGRLCRRRQTIAI